MQVIFHGADLQALEVLNGLNGTSGENISEADVHPADSVNALSGGLLCDKLTDLTVDNAMSLIGIIEKEGLVENCHLGNERSEDSVGSGEHVNGAKLSALIHISLVSELAARKDFDLDAAFGCFLNFLSDRESALVEVAAVGVNHAELERDDIGRSCGIGAYGRVVLGCGCSGRGAAGAAACEQAGDHGNAKNDCCEFFHFFSFFY